MPQEIQPVEDILEKLTMQQRFTNMANRTFKTKSVQDKVGQQIFYFARLN